jgi:hypothetical protein
MEPRDYETRPSGAGSILADMSVGPAARLDLGPAPRSAAGVELAALLVQGRTLRDRVDAIDAEQRQASEDVVRLSAELADLERRAAAGEQVSAKKREAAEAALAKARSRHAEPWAERRAGVQAAVRDHERQVVIFVGQHFSEVYGELAEDAEAAATRVDNACHELIAAFHERMLIEGRVTTLAAMVRAPELGGVARTHAEAVAAAASALLQSGGEQAPLLRDDPRQPASVQRTVEAEADREPEPVTAT